MLDFDTLAYLRMANSALSSAIDADAMAQAQAALRRRILRAFVGRGLTSVVSRSTN
jgi:hypothetical protein